MVVRRSKGLNIFFDKRYLLDYSDTLDEMLFNGKNFVETGHFKRELYDVYGKNLDLVIDILERGKHSIESKSKTKAELRTFNGTWELVYVEGEGEIILVHLKLRR